MPYSYDANAGVWIRKEYQGIPYSDGLTIERRLETLVEGSNDRTTLSTELAGTIEDWATEYHFSRQRHCLLRPLDIKPGDRILELGCGCGAMTRYLGETGAEVISVEGSPQRAKIARKRCRDLQNVTIYCDNLLAFESSETFDWVLLIGVLEYAPVYSNHADPVAHYLDQAKRFLAPGACLVVAIENQLGLKYFNGRPEDHLGMPFYGTNDLYTNKTPITFGRKELGEVLRRAGFGHQSLYLPFPDYKLPTTIIHESATALPGFRAAELLSQIESRDYSGQMLPLFSEGLSNQALQRNGLLSDLANSFLMVCSTSPIQQDASTLAWHYSIGHRKQPYCIETRFEQKDSGIRCRKLPLEPSISQPPPRVDKWTLHQQLDESVYLSGELLSLSFQKQKFSATSTTELAEAFFTWFQAIFSRATCVAGKDASRLDSWIIDGEWLDATPFNTVIKGEDCDFFDLEWRLDGPIPLGWLLYRAVLWTLPRGLSSTFRQINGVEVFNEICRGQQLTWDTTNLETYRRLEQSLMDAVNVDGKSVETRLESVNSLFPYFSSAGSEHLTDIQAQAHHAAHEQLKADLTAANATVIAAKAAVELEKARYQSLLEQHNHLCQLHARERHTVIKPLARLALHAMRKTYRHAPAPIKQHLRQLASKFPVLRSRLSGSAMARPMMSGTALDMDAPSPWTDTILAARSNLPDILVFPVIDWHFRVQRPQHLARSLAQRGHRVFYLTTTFSHSETPGFRIEESPESNVFIVRLTLPATQPSIYTSVMSDTLADQIVAALDRLYLAFNIGPAAALIDLPFWRRATRRLSATLEVYDCMDHHAGFSTNEGDLQELEESELLKTADVVVSTSARLHEKLLPITDSVLIRNAGEVDFFARRPESLAYQSDKPVVGYYGAISDWFDMELLVKMAKQFPEWQFLMVGEVTHPSPKAAMNLPNVTFTGEVPYVNLPGYLYAFDVCVIPFLINELTLCTNPVKIYEYLAAGKPVVATDMPELRMIDDMCHVCIDHEQFLSSLDTAMQESQDNTLAASRTEWAMQHDWDQRAGLLQQAIQDAWPKVSVIVLTYNNLDFTRACLESVEKHTRYPNLELIIVDNASTDETPEFLRQYGEDHGDVTIILNDSNLGFAAGNNVGLRAATGDYLVLLNNDTYVSDGWLHGLIRHFRQYPKLGLIGPVTNNIGNEAKIDTQYQSMSEMLTEARGYTRRHTDNLLFVDTVAFFCVGMSRETYDKVGEMDEDFILGFFEDDDYCRRVKQAGLDIAIANDTFVHHHLSASFNKLGDQRKQELFEANKAVYEKKWGKWVPHQYR